MNTAFFNIILAAETAQSQAANSGDAAAAGAMSPASQLIYYLVSFGLVALVIYLFMIRPQRKKDKEQKAMKDALQIGDEVTTIGGITGIIVRINKNAQNSADDSVVIETGGDRNKVRVKMWAISENATMHDAAPEEAAVSKK